MSARKLTQEAIDRYSALETRSKQQMAGFACFPGASIEWVPAETAAKRREPTISGDFTKYDKVAESEDPQRINWVCLLCNCGGPAKNAFLAAQQHLEGLRLCPGDLVIGNPTPSLFFPLEAVRALRIARRRAEQKQQRKRKTTTMKPKTINQ